MATNERENTTSYVHPQETNLLNLHKALEYNGDGKPILRVSVGGESITITGDVTIPGSVEINNDEGSPIPAHVHLFGDDGVEYSDSNPLMTKLDAPTLAALETVELGSSTLSALEQTTISGTVELGATTLSALETTTVEQGTTPWVTSLNASTLAALESVDLNPATLAALETTELGATTLAALETTELGATTLAALENVTVDSVTANVTVEGEVELGSTSLAALENISIDAGDITVAGEVALDSATLAALETTDLGATTLAALETTELGATTLAALENVTVDNVVGNVTIEGEVALDSAALSALENIIIDTISGTVTVDGEVELGATTLAALETTSIAGNVTVEGEVALDSAALTALENITIDTISGTVTVDGEVALDSATLLALETTALDGATLAALETTSLSATTLAALETTELGATTLAALETTSVEGNVQVEGEVELGSTSLAALENISIDAGNLQVGGTIVTNQQDYLFDLADGDISGKTSVDRIGRNSALLANALETLWDPRGLASYLTSASSVYITSDNGADAVAGTGARTIEVKGLDENYALATENVNVDDGASTTTFIRVFGARTKTAGSGNEAAGTITIRSASGGGGIILSQIQRGGSGAGEASYGQSMNAMYTIPAGKTGYLQQLNAGNNNETGQTNVFVVSRDFGETMFITDDIAMVSGDQITKEYKVPLRFAEKSDIEIRGLTTGTGISQATAGFNLVLVDNA